MICKDKNRKQKDIVLAVTPLLPSSYFCLEIQTPLPPKIVDVIYGWPLNKKKRSEKIPTTILIIAQEYYLEGMSSTQQNTKCD